MVCYLYDALVTHYFKRIQHSQIQHDNLVQEDQEAQVAQLVPLVQADLPVRSLLPGLEDQVLLELPVGLVKDEINLLNDQNKNKYRDFILVFG